MRPTKNVQTLTVEQAAQLLGISRGLAYQAAREGEIPTIRLGRRVLVPRARLLELVGASGVSAKSAANEGSAD
jgi:excisionase family DNA binding protein